MNKKILLSLMFGMIFLIGIVSAGTVTVTLNTPADDSVWYNNQVDMESTSSTDATSINNISLWTNESGTWELKNTTQNTRPTSTNDHNVSMSSFASGGEAIGVKIIPNADINVSHVVKYAGSGGTRVRIYDENGTLMATTTDLSGSTFTISGGVVLSSGRLYAVMIDASGSSFDKWYGTTTTPISDANLTWQYGAGNAEYPFSNISNNLYGIDQIKVSDNPVSSYTGNITRTYNAGDSILWNIQACDDEGSCSFANSNFTFFVDNDEPVFAINYPSAIINYSVIGEDLQFNFTATDTNLDDCWIEYDDTNYSVSCSSGTDTLYNLTLSATQTAKVGANDTAGNENVTVVSWESKILQNSVNYSANTIEGTTEDFTLNLTKGSSYQVSTIYLNYNGTSYSSTVQVNGDSVLATNSIAIPDVSTTTNITFYWEILMTDSTEINTTSYNQTIVILDIDDCSVYTGQIFDYTLYDEETQVLLNSSNASIEIQINVYDKLRTQSIMNFSNQYNNSNTATVCLNTPLYASTNYSLDSVVKYTSNNTVVNGSEYDTEYYNILNFTMANSTLPKSIKLYPLKSDDTTEFQLTFRDQYLALDPNIIVYVNRQYVSDNDYKTVEAPLTDSNGQTILHLVRNGVVYNLIMVDSAGNIVATFNHVIAFCQDYTIGSCTINLNARSTEDNVYNYNEDTEVSYSLSYSNSTNLISLTFLSTDLETKEIRMDVIRNSDFGNRTVCSTSLSASSGTLTCNTTSILDTDRFLFIDVYSGGKIIGTETIDLDESTSGFGANGYFIALLVVLFFITLFMDDKQGLIIAIILGWVVVIAFGLVEGALVGFLSGGIWLIVCAIIMLFKLKKEENR